MKALLLYGFGISVNVDGRNLVIHNNQNNETLWFQPHQISYNNIFVDGYYGNVSFEALRWLSKHGITLSLLNWNGNLLSVMLPKEPITGKLKIKQYKAYLDNVKRYTIAEKIIYKKVDKSYELLSALSKFYKNVSKNAIDNAFYYERQSYLRDNGNKSIRNLMAYEGRIADIYWKTLSKIFYNLYPEFNFRSRKNKSYSQGMNASDYVNALLNYGYAILESVIRRDINVIGLDPNIGFLHEISDSKTPLVYDLQELYRWLVDLSVIQLLEDKKLKKSDFIVTENYHIRLRESAVKALLDKITANFNTKASYKGTVKTYETVLLDNTRVLANYVRNRHETLSFVIPVHNTNRTDTMNVRGQIMAITPEERKRLGINKSTLWYRQKAIKEGKRIRLYGSRNGMIYL